MARPANLYQNVTAIEVDGEVFKTHREAAICALGNLFEAAGCPKSMSQPDVIEWIVANRGQLIRTLDIPEPRKPRTPKTKPEGK